MKRIEISDGSAERAFSKVYDCFIVGIGNESRIDFVLKQLIDKNVMIGEKIIESIETEVIVIDPEVAEV